MQNITVAEVLWWCEWSGPSNTKGKPEGESLRVRRSYERTKKDRTRPLFYVTSWRILPRLGIA